MTPFGRWVAVPVCMVAAGVVLVQCTSARPPLASTPSPPATASSTAGASPSPAGGTFQPQNAAPYLDRARTDPGLLHDGDPAVHVFTDRGWRWGGHWTTPVDYQHFERS